MQQDPADARYVDLHIHTTFSDGTSSVEEVVDTAAGKGLRAISVTDHDSVDAYPKVTKLASKVGIEVVPGVELSSEFEGIDIHILGYNIDVAYRPFTQRLQEIKDARYVRAKKMVRNLNTQGIDLRFETVLKIAGEGAIGRPHIAAAMLREELVYSFREAFEKHIGYESPAYVEKLKMHPKEVFELVMAAGGVPVLAHPGVTQVDERIPEFISYGLAGIEVFHSEHTGAAVRHYKRLCRKYGLLMTGGSDYHSGEHNKSEIGVPSVPYYVVERLNKRHAQFLQDR